MTGLIVLEYDNSTYQADLVTDANGLIRQDGAFEGPTTASLFSWARAELDGQQLFGWWGDSFSDAVQDSFGSALWTFRRAKNSLPTQSALQRQLELDLQWLTEDGIAAGVSVEIERFSLNAIAGKISIARADGSRWDRIWSIQRNALQ